MVVTPAHQFPTGVVMSPERRAALLGWAEAVDGLIVEDDYDSELRYDRGPVGALQGLAPERVCLIGSVGKRLAPALRMRRMRIRYRRRRSALAAVLAEAVPEAVLVGVPAGLYALAILPEGISEPAVVRAAAAVGVWVEGLSSHQTTGGGGGQVGVLLGYANLSEAAIDRGMALLASAVGELSHTS